MIEKRLYLPSSIIFLLTALVATQISFKRDSSLSLNGSVAVGIAQLPHSFQTCLARCDCRDTSYLLYRQNSLYYLGIPGAAAQIATKF